MIALLFAFLTAACFYLGSRAVITRWLWSRYPSWLGRFLDCAACSGFWYGLALAATVGNWERLSYLGLDLSHAYNWPLVGLVSIVVTPIVASVMQRGLQELGSAYPPIEPEPAGLVRTRLE